MTILLPPPGSRLIPLTQGKFAIVDEDMFDELNQFKWFYHCGYARRNSSRSQGEQCTIHMSRVVANTPDGFQCDHISLNRLDNRRANLRLASPVQNNYNKSVLKNNACGVKGVHCQKDYKKYRARIGVNGKCIYLGVFETVEMAAAAYSEAAHKYHGEFARG